MEHNIASTICLFGTGALAAPFLIVLFALLFRRSRIHHQNRRPGRNRPRSDIYLSPTEKE